MKISLLFSIVFFVISTLQAQKYIPADTIHTNSQEVLKYFNDHTKDLEKEFKAYPVANRKIIKSFVQSRKEMFEELTKGNNLLYDEELEQYLNDILLRVAQNNNIDPKPLRMFLSRNTDPNAYSLGDGNFVFHISLLNRLENEEEVYFLVAHELAHYSLDHLKKQMTAKMELIESKEFASKQKEIRKTKYRKYSKSLERYRDLLYDNGSISRKRELEADSLAFFYLKNMVSNPHNMVSALSKLDSLSPSEIYKIDLDIMKDHFSTSSMSFQEEWTAGYDFSKYNYQRGKVSIFGIHKDSLKSHPEREERMLNIKKFISDAPIPPSKDMDEFQKLKEKIAFEDVYAHYCLEEYGRGIYLILQLQNAQEQSLQAKQFYAEMLSLFYENLALARRSFTFKKYVDDVDIIRYSQEYSLFLTILDNLRSSDLQELATKFKA